MRAGTCAGMCAGTRTVRHAPLESSRRGGRFGYRHVYPRVRDMRSAMPMKSRIRGVDFQRHLIRHVRLLSLPSALCHRACAAPHSHACRHVCRHAHSASRTVGKLSPRRSFWVPTRLYPRARHAVGDADDVANSGVDFQRHLVIHVRLLSLPSTLHQRACVETRAYMDMCRNGIDR